MNLPHKDHEIILDEIFEFNTLQDIKSSHGTNWIVTNHNILTSEEGLYPSYLKITMGNKTLGLSSHHDRSISDKERRSAIISVTEMILCKLNDDNCTVTHSCPLYLIYGIDMTGADRISECRCYRSIASTFEPLVSEDIVMNETNEISEYGLVFLDGSNINYHYCKDNQIGELILREYNDKTCAEVIDSMVNLVIGGKGTEKRPNNNFKLFMNYYTNEWNNPLSKVYLIRPIERVYDRWYPTNNDYSTMAKEILSFIQYFCEEFIIKNYPEDIRTVPLLERTRVLPHSTVPNYIPQDKKQAFLLLTYWRCFYICISCLINPKKSLKILLEGKDKANQYNENEQIWKTCVLFFSAVTSMKKWNSIEFETNLSKMPFILRSRTVLCYYELVLEEKDDFKRSMRVLCDYQGERFYLDTVYLTK
jgi:hypothetical protein